MLTGTTNKEEIGKIVQGFVDQGYIHIKVELDVLGQWIITANYN